MFCATGIASKSRAEVCAAAGAEIRAADIGRAAVAAASGEGRDVAAGFFGDVRFDSAPGVFGDFVLPISAQRGGDEQQTLAAERTVVLVEHKMKLVMGICQRLVVLHQGELLAEGSPHEIRQNSEVKRVYLGSGA